TEDCLPPKAVERDRLATGRFPESDHLLLIAGYQAPAITAEANAQDLCFMALAENRVGDAFDVPEAHATVSAGCGQTLAIGTIGQVANQTVGFAQAAGFLAAGGIQKADLLATQDRQAPTVWAKNRVTLAVSSEQCLAFTDIPDREFLILIADCQAPAIRTEGE